jgi:hypothetical protein
LFDSAIDDDLADQKIMIKSGRSNDDRIKGKVVKQKVALYIKIFSNAGETMLARLLASGMTGNAKESEAEIPLKKVEAPGKPMIFNFNREIV